MSLAALDSRWTARSQSLRTVAFVLCAVVGLLACGASSVQADADIYAYASQYDASSWIIEGWVFADNPAGLDVKLLGIPSGTRTVRTDIDGYFFLFVQLDLSSADLAATVDVDDVDYSCEIE